MLDRVQELALLERIQELGADRRHLATAVNEVANQVVQAPRIDPRLALESLQLADLVIELLLYFAAYVAAGQNGEDLEQGRNRGTRRPGGVVLAVVEHLLVKELEPQKSTHTLAEGEFVEGLRSSSLGSDVSCGFRHRRILKDALLTGK